MPFAIDSCRNTNCKTEIIVIDDGSTDGTWEWLSKQGGLIVARQENLGKCWAANHGYQLSLGKYVRFLDSDDMLSPGAIDSQFELAESSNCDIVVSGYKVIDQHSIVIKQHPWIDCDDFMAQQLGECDGSHYSAFLFTKDILKDIPHRPDYALRDDRLLILEAALKEPRISVSPNLALLHRIHPNPRLQHTGGMQQITQNYQHLKIYQYILNQLAIQGKLNNRRKSAAVKILWPLAHWVAKTHLDEARKIYDWIYELSPDFRPTENLSLARLYKTLGFVNTEKILRVRRAIANVFR